MNKISTRIILLLLFIVCYTVNTAAQTINITNVDAGPYGRRSNIMVPITLNGCFNIGNRFNLYLSDENGNFNGNGTSIGSFDGFYATFINGAIPPGATTGTGYRVRVMSTNPVTTSAASSAFSINAVAGTPIDLNSTELNNNEEVFGTCDNATTGAGTIPYNISNATDATATVTATITNELTNTNAALTLNTNFAAQAAHYTIAARAVAANGTISTKGYLLVNNRPMYSAFDLQVNTACLSSGGSASIPINTGPANPTDPTNRSIRNAFPGNTYTMDWGDNSSDPPLRVCDLLAAGALNHSYNSSSCGQRDIPVGNVTYRNTYGLNLLASNVFCNKVGSGAIGAVKVLAPALTNFNIQGQNGNQLFACAGNVTLRNISDPGDNPNLTSSSCKNPDARYNWYVNGQPIATNRPLAQNITHPFTAPGTYTIRLELISGSPCQSDPNDATNFMEKTICVQNPPQPNFTIQGQNAAITICGGAQNTVTPVNNSVVDQSCQAVTALWTVTGGPAGGATITGPVNSLTTPPQITFNAAGVYRVRLTLSSATCLSVTHEVEVTVKTTPVAELPADISICGGVPGQIVYSGNTASTFYARLEGTAVPDATTYEWRVTNTTGTITATVSDPAAKYPTISYSGIGSFTVEVTHRNGCTPDAQDSQIITVEDSPQLTPGTYTAVCPGDNIPLNLTTVNGNYQSVTWNGGTGTFSPSRNVLNPVYTPSQAEIQAGGLTLEVVVNTGLSGTCSTITEQIPLTIRPQNIITSASAKTICSGSNVDYDITAQSGSTFTWTVVSSTNVTGAQPSNPDGTQINDQLTNTSPTGADGEVVYRITPFNSGCQGVSFTFTVTVVADAVPTFTASATSACGEQDITFTNTTASRSGDYRWDWDDGSALETNNSTAPITHHFTANADGTDRRYRVRLIHVYACGTTISEQIITVKPAVPIARIGIPTRAGVNGSGNGECGSFVLTVPNQSPGDGETYVFRLEDENGNLVPGNIVTSQNPVRKTIAGDKSAAQFTIEPTGNATYYIRMIADNGCNEGDIPNRWSIPVSTSGVSDMRLPQNRACERTPVIFENNSTGTSFTYTVYRADGSVFDRFNVTETQRSYTYTGFTEDGIFDVTVTAQSAGCGNAPESIRHRITIEDVPTISFTANTVGCDNLIYQFTPTGVNSASYTYYWDFGDGTDAPGPNPGPHTYAAPGTYTVTLTVTNQLGCNVPVEPQVVVAKPRLVADFTVLPGEEISIPNYHFSFRDNSEGVPASWHWDFGNGQSSTLPNPEYTYPATDIGSHLVTLTVTNIAPDGSTCESVKQKAVTISGTPGTLFIPNAFIPSSSSTAIQTFMAKGSGIASWHMQIFNKWGQLVWETNKLGADGEPLEGWDGTYKGSPAPQGAYVWQVSAKFINGTEWKGMSYRNSPPKRSGVINLIR